MKRIASLILFLAFAQAAHANPFSKVTRFVKDHPRWTAMEASGVTGALLHAGGLRHCLHGELDRCPEERYGANWAFYGVLTGWSTIVGPAIAEACWKDQDDWKGCYFFGYSGAATQTAFGIYDFRNYKPEDKPDPCHDLRCEERRFRVH